MKIKLVQKREPNPSFQTEDWFEVYQDDKWTMSKEIVRINDGWDTFEETIDLLTNLDSVDLEVQRHVNQ